MAMAEKVCSLAIRISITDPFGSKNPLNSEEVIMEKLLYHGTADTRASPWNDHFRCLCRYENGDRSIAAGHSAS